MVFEDLSRTKKWKQNWPAICLNRSPKNLPVGVEVASLATCSVWPFIHPSTHPPELGKFVEVSIQIQFNSFTIQLNSIQFNSSHFGSVVNSIQFNSLLFAIQFINSHQFISEYQKWQRLYKIWSCIHIPTRYVLFRQYCQLLTTQKIYASDQILVLLEITIWYGPWTEDQWI